MKKFWQITEFGTQGERDWLVQADSSLEAIEMLTTLIPPSDVTMPSDVIVELLLVREVPTGEVEKILSSLQDLAFVCINS